MTISGYVIIYLLTVIMLMYCIVAVGKYEKKIAVTIRKFLIFIVLAAGIKGILLFVEHNSLCMAVYGVFFVCMDWMLYHLLKFAFEYAGLEMKDYVKQKPMCLLLFIDTGSLLLNFLFGHAFSCQKYVLESGVVYYVVEGRIPYYVHLGLCYILMVFTFICLIYQAKLAPALYRRKYLVILSILAFAVVADSVYIFTDVALDLSVMAFAISGVLIYYFTLIYEPGAIPNRALALMVDDMSEAVLLYDAEGKCIRVNDSARNLLGIDGDNTFRQEKEFAKFFNSADAKEHDGKIWDHIIERDGEELHLRIRYHWMSDEKGRYLGSFLTILDCTEEVHKHQKEHYLATHDRLTKLYNREHFYERAEQMLNEHPREEYLMVCTDVRNFKLVNDVFGARTGDRLLVKIAEAFQKYAAPEREVYGRLENDRFGLLMPKKYFEEAVFERVADEIAEIDEDHSYPVHIHIGVYEITNKTIPISVMCDRAFMALGMIKDNYQKKIAYYDEKLRESALHEQELAGELDKAIADGHFYIYLQPQISVEGNVGGAEALVRWIHPERGMIMPGAFIEAFERNGMIAKLDQHIWELACQQLKKWKEQGKNDMYLSVNISPKDFYFLDIYRVFTELVERYEISPKNLKLEITETAVMMNLERQLELIGKLRDAGFVVEMDDFGSGYSSLNMLKDISVDVLKIDMAFLRETQEEERGRKILKMVIELSKALGMPVITEGVETKEQVDFLTEIGCDMFQGYFFAKPMAVEAFEAQYM